MVTDKLLRIVIIVITSCLLPCCTSSITPISHYPNISLDKVIPVLKERAKKIKTIEATLTITIHNQNLEGPRKLKGFIAIRKPGTIRFKGFVSFGLEVFDLIISNNDFQLFLPTKNELHQGNLEDAHDTLTTLPLLPENIISVFDSTIFDSSQLSCQESEGLYLISLFPRSNDPSEKNKQLWFEKKQLKLTLMDIYSKGELDLRYTFNNHKCINENYFPYRVTITKVQEGTSINVTVNTIKVNYPIDSNAFRFNPDTTKSIPRVDK